MTNNKIDRNVVPGLNNNWAPQSTRSLTHTLHSWPHALHCIVTLLKYLFLVSLMNFLCSRNCALRRSSCTRRLWACIILRTRTTVADRSRSASGRRLRRRSRRRQLRQRTLFLTHSTRTSSNQDIHQVPNSIWVLLPVQKLIQRVNFIRQQSRSYSCLALRSNGGACHSGKYAAEQQFRECECGNWMIVGGIDIIR